MVRCEIMRTIVSMQQVYSGSNTIKLSFIITIKCFQTIQFFSFFNFFFFFAFKNCSEVSENEKLIVLIALQKNPAKINMRWRYFSY